MCFILFSPSSLIIHVISHFVTPIIAQLHFISHCTTDDGWCFIRNKSWLKKYEIQKHPHSWFIKEIFIYHICLHWSSEKPRWGVANYVYIHVHSTRSGMSRDYRDYRKIRFQYAFRQRENPQPHGRNLASFSNPCGVENLTLLRKLPKTFKPITKRVYWLLVLV